MASASSRLEAESDRERRRELADARAAEGRSKLDEYLALKQEVKRLEREAEEVAKRFKGWQPTEEKRELVEAQNVSRDAERRLVARAAGVVATLEGALAHDPTHAVGREALADYYWDRFRDAEAAIDDKGRDFNAERVALYHDGKYVRELRGDGTLTLTSDPAGAERSCIS